MSRMQSTAAAVLAAMVTATSPAGAQEYMSQLYITAAAGACQSALPVFDTLLRKRPLAVQNEGNSTAFVTCAVSNPSHHAGSPLRMSSQRVTLGNLNDARVWVSCTQVVNLWGRDQLYLVQSDYISADGNTTLFFVEAPATVSAISCALPPGVGVRRIEHNEWNGIPMGSVARASPIP